MIGHIDAPFVLVNQPFNELLKHNPGHAVTHRKPRLTRLYLRYETCPETEERSHQVPAGRPEDLRQHQEDY